MGAFSIGWLSTGRDRAARDLLSTVGEAMHHGEIPGRISFVFSNRETGEDEESDRFFTLVREYHIPLICLSSRRFKEKWPSPPPEPQWREEYDREVLSRLRGYRADLCILAGYMLIASRVLCQRLKMINLHPAAPGGPKGSWQEVVWQLMALRAESSGVMMHLVTPELDRGPAVAFCRFSLRGQPFDRYWGELAPGGWPELKAKYGESHPLFQLIRQEGLKREFPLIIATLKLLAEKRVKIERGMVRDGQDRPIPGYDLTDEIEAALVRSHPESALGESRGG